MKKQLLVFLVFALFATTNTFAATYYWVGGAGPTSWATAANWNTTLGGGGSVRTTPNTSDVLIFDGSNIGAGATGAITITALVAETNAQLKFVNNASVTIGTSSTRVITIGGDTGDDFIIESGSSLTVGLASFTSAVTLFFNPSTTGKIDGTLTLQLGSHKITPAAVANCITFSGTSTFNYNVTTGNVFGTAAVATNNNVVFQSGANFNYLGGGNPFGSTAPASVCEFQDGSNFNVNTSSAISFSNRPYANLIINNSQTTSGAPSRLGSLTVNNGAALTLNSGSAIPITGNITLNGTGNIAITGSLPTLLFCGSTPQTVNSAGGTIGAFSRVLVASDADVTLNTNLTVAPTSAAVGSINGKLTLGTNTITGNANATFRASSAASIASVTGDLTLGSQILTNVSNTSNFNLGMTVNGAGIPANAVVLSTAATTITISKTITSGTATGVSISAYNNAGNIVTSNTGGIAGSLPSFTAYQLNAGSSYTFNGATTTPFPAAVSVANLTTAANVTLNNDVAVTGTLTLTSGLLSTGGLLTLKSDAASTARLAPVTGGSISGNVTVERFIPAKASRKWSFVTAPVTGTTVRNAWQQQVFITGAGTTVNAGAPCTGTTNGNDVLSTDKYNSNGFDITANNSPSMYSYNGAAATTLRWIALPNTSTALVAGKGYRLNVRGARGASDANCTAQINTASPAAPTAATLSATGTLSVGDVPVALDGVAGDYTLLGNPYASSIDFDLFNTDNATLAGKYWFYSPENTAAGIASTAYSAYTTGSMTNKPTGYTDANAKNIASGQSFYVQQAAAASVTFKETHKINAQSGSFRTQSYDWSNAIRAGLQNADGSVRIDEVLVRFGNVAGASKNYTDAWDARSINEGAPVIVSLKGTERLAIQTRPLNFFDDTVKLGVTINTIGSYRLAFSEHEAFASAQTIKLKDKFLNLEQDIKANAVYPFSVTSDASSKGDNRFEIVFKSNGALPVSYIGITAKNKGLNDVEVNWQLPSETDVKQYQVERSANGRNFDVRGTILSRGNSLTSQSYTYTDAPRLSGTSYYRIKATDKSGIVNYSPVVKVSNGKEQLTVAIYPNPVKEKLNMVLQNVDGSYTIKISTMEGKTMLVQNGNSAAGNIVTINTAALAAGVYMVETTDSKGNRSIEKMVKQ